MPMKKTKTIRGTKAGKRRLDVLMEESQKLYPNSAIKCCQHFVRSMTKEDYEQLKAEAKRMFPD